MDNLYININPELVFYPVVKFDYSTGICEISGESYMENASIFYEPVINWLREFTRKKKPVTFNIKLIYFSTRSSKYILDILDILKAHKKEGYNVIVNWYYKKDDSEMLKEIDEFTSESGIEINALIC